MWLVLRILREFRVWSLMWKWLGQCAAERRDMEVPYEGACVSAPGATRTDDTNDEASESGRACCCHGEATKVAIEK